MPENPCSSSPNSPRRFCSAKGGAPGAGTTGPLLLCPADLPGVSLAVSGCRHASQPRHVHDSLILGVVTAGARRIRTPHADALVNAGEVFALPPGLAHACEPAPCREAAEMPDADNGKVCAYFAFSLQTESLPPLALESLPIRLNNAALSRTLSRLAEAVQQECGCLERQSLLAQALEVLADCAGTREQAVWVGADLQQTQSASQHALALAVQRAKALLESESGAECSLPGLAQACGVDMYALHRAFTRMVGLPPHAYQTHLRLRRAKALLRSGASASEAALEAGFCDQSHLNRHFARLVGLTPAQYAKAHKGRRQGQRPSS